MILFVCLELYQAMSCFPLQQNTKIATEKPGVLKTPGNMTGTIGRRTIAAPHNPGTAAKGSSASKVRDWQLVSMT